MLLLRCPLGGKELPIAPSPTWSVPTSSSSLCRVDSHSRDLPAATHPPAHGPRGRTGHPLSCRSPVPPGPWSGGTLTTSACPASSACTDGSFQERPLWTAAALPPHKRGLPRSWVHSSKCRWPGVLQHPLRVPQTQAWARGWLWTPVTIQGQQRLFPTPAPDSNACNSAPDEVATKPLLLSTDHPEVCKISPQFLKQTCSFHTSGGPPQQLWPPWRHPEAERPSPPSCPDAWTALSPRPMSAACSRPGAPLLPPLRPSWVSTQTRSHKALPTVPH